MPIRQIVILLSNSLMPNTLVMKIKTFLWQKRARERERKTMVWKTMQIPYSLQSENIRGYATLLVPPNSGDPGEMLVKFLIWLPSNYRAQNPPKPTTGPLSISRTVKHRQNATLYEPFRHMLRILTNLLMTSAHFQKMSRDSGPKRAIRAQLVIRVLNQ